MTATTETLADAYRAFTDGCGLVDRSERGKLALTGAEAKAFLQGQVTNDIEALEPGRGCYAAFLTHKGKMLGDMRVLDLGDELLLDTERVALQGLFNMIRRFKLGSDVELHKRTLELGLLSLIGPRRAGRRRRGLGAPSTTTPAPRSAAARCARRDRRRRRHLLRRRRRHACAPRSRPPAPCPSGEEAAEVVRVERGRPRYGVELDDSVIPQEAGLNERAVSFTKGCYVGQETVARLFYRGKPNRHLRGLRLCGPAATGDVLRLGEKEVGRVGSVVVSPVHGPIGAGARAARGGARRHGLGRRRRHHRRGLSSCRSGSRADRLTKAGMTDGRERARRRQPDRRLAAAAGRADPPRRAVADRHMVMPAQARAAPGARRREPLDQALAAMRERRPRGRGRRSATPTRWTRWPSTSTRRATTR